MLRPYYSPYRAQQHAFQVAGLRHVEQVGMVGGGASCRDELYATARVACGVGEHGVEEVPAHVIRAGRGEEHAIRCQDLHRPEMDFLVAGEGTLEVRLCL